MAKGKNKGFKVIDKRGMSNGEVTPDIVAPPIEVVEIPDVPDYDSINLEMKMDRILVQIFPLAKMIGAIHTPDGRDVPIDKGRICKIGPDVKNLKVGDVVFKVSGLGQALTDSKDRLYTFHPENAVIAVDTDFDKKE